MRSITQSRELNAEYTRMRIDARCEGCAGTEGDCTSMFILIPAGSVVTEIPKSEWKGCGVPQPVFLKAVDQSSINFTWKFDSLPNPTKLIVDFNSPSSFDIWLQLTF